MSQFSWNIGRFYGYKEDNLEAYNYLKAHGINVHLDFESDTDHMKIVIIDGEIIYIGSHNWSESALYYNHEVSIRVVSKELAKLLQSYINSLIEG
ncbi:MAG: phospholipase D-like domain-containing protein [Candidatus Nezhaarchaeales archaeon]